MAYRTFVDRNGAYWQVWDSQPTKMERRNTPEDRRHIRRFPWKGVERRSGRDRRTVSQRRIALAEGYGRGWLTFESLEEKRRMIPIPAAWESATQEELRILCIRAQLVARTEGGSSVA
ncbi:MAG: hypothetical protein ABI408_10845 [Gemmatimonadaceae bacterium]